MNVGNIAVSVGIGVAAGVGIGGGYLANRLDPDGGANKALTVTSGVTALATGVGSALAFAAMVRAGDPGRIVLPALAFLGLGTVAIGSGAIAAGSLGADLLNLGN